MTPTYYILLILIFIGFFAQSQTMEHGFNHLENGNYTKAILFFESVLRDYPNNKTAQLCHARALGLSGKTETAKLQFAHLLERYPNDFEIQLNYAESLLWNAEFNLAKPYYERLIQTNNKSFSALLGYANTLSNLKLYKEALTYVNKALSISEGNANALQSKKYIYLGYAYKKQQEQQFVDAENILKEALVFFPNDKDALLNLANLYLIMDELNSAEGTYNTLANNTQNSILAKNGLALTAHLKHHDKKALKLSKHAFLEVSNTTDEILKKQTTERYIQALIWNRKYNKAEVLINEMLSIYNEADWVLALRATLSTYKGDFKNSLLHYNALLTKDSSSFDGNLGKANALKALGQYKLALKAADTTLRFHNNQKDVLGFKKNLNTLFTPYIETKALYSFDNGNTTALTYKAHITYPTTTRFKWLADYSLRNTSNRVFGDNASTNTFTAGMGYQLHANLNITATAGMVNTEAESGNYIKFITDAALKLKLFKLQNLDFGFARNIQNFNADLLNRQIVSHDVYANYTIGTNINLGCFTQYYHTFQNDGNTRNLVFTSLYYTVLHKPNLKMGLNYQYITFKNEVPDVYFSPKKFQAYEVFANLIADEANAKPKAWFYELTAAIGQQYIVQRERQSTYRVNAKIGFKSSDRLLFNVFGNRSNIASVTATGFSYTEFGVRMKWYITTKSIFKNE